MLTRAPAISFSLSTRVAHVTHVTPVAATHVTRLKRRLSADPRLLSDLSANHSSRSTDREQTQRLTAQAQQTTRCSAQAATTARCSRRRSAMHSHSIPHARIVESLESGVMAVQGMPLTRKQKRDVAFFLTGERFDDLQTTADHLRLHAKPRERCATQSASNLERLGRWPRQRALSGERANPESR
jgi:hypothetical protein